MIRLSVPLACSALAVVLSVPAAAQTPNQKPSAEISAVPACIYSSKTYSEGATVCVQKSLMLKCMSDGTKALWTQVEDKSLNDKCRARSTRGSIYQQRARWHRQNIRKQITPPG